MSWQEIAQKKRDSLIALIPSQWRLPTPLPSAQEQKNVTGATIEQYLSTREIEMTTSNATDILKNIANSDWRSREVTEAFCHRAALAHQMINCLHEIFFDAALQEADRLDAYFDQHKKPIGPLHGLPISLKDMLHVKGLDTSMGYVGWLNNFEGKTGTGKEKVFESEIVKELRALGAVLYVKTSVPQSLMVHEGTNNLIGYTENPKNRLLSVGGSTGGEGGLLALKGSALGIGTDIGGSVRVPAAWNGIYGLKPSTGRLPFEGVAVSMDGQISAPTALGPMATSPEALTLLTKAVLSREPWHHDSTVVPMPWNDETYQAILKQAKSADNPLCFAILRTDGIVNPHPPIARAINQTISAIESLGHKVIDWQPPAHSTAISLRLKTWVWDGGHDIHAQLALSGEPPLPHVVASYGKEPSSQLNVSEVNATNIAIREYRKAYMEYWNSTDSLTGTGRPVDAVIMPVAPYAAAPRGKNVYPGYSIFVNVLDYAVAAFPVTEVDERVDAKYDVEGYAKLNDTDGMVHDMWNPELFQGAPVGLQIIGRRLEEEKILALTEVIGHAVKELDTVRSSKL